MSNKLFSYSYSKLENKMYSKPLKTIVFKGFYVTELKTNYILNKLSKIFYFENIFRNGVKTLSFRIFSTFSTNLMIYTFFKKKGLNSKISGKSVKQQNSKAPRSAKLFFKKNPFLQKKGFFLKKRLYSWISVDSAIFAIFASH